MANMKIKIKWKVCEPSIGRYRSFYPRGWPSAEYENGNHCARIYCSDKYVPRNVKTGNHSELTVAFADWRTKPWTRKSLKKRFKTLKEAKEAFQEFIEKHPEFAGDNINQG